MIFADLAFDNDGSVHYGRIHYSLSAISPTTVPFSILSNGSVLLSEPVDYEDGRVDFSFQVLATDGSLNASDVLGTRCGYSNASFRVMLINENDELPYFVQTTYALSIAEDTAVSSPIGHLRFNDPDKARNSFSFRVHPLRGQLPPPFVVRPDGTVVLTQNLNYESTVRQFHFNVSLFDGVHTALSPAIVTVNVVNVNEFLPTFDRDYFATLNENVAPSEGVVIVNATDMDAEEFGEIMRYELSGQGSELFTIDNGGVIRNTRPLDYETDRTEFFLTATAHDGGGEKQLYPCGDHSRRLE